MEMLLKRFEERVLAQPRPVLMLETAECLGAFGIRGEVMLAEMPVETLEKRHLQAGHLHVVDELGCAGRLNGGLELRGYENREHVRAFTRFRNRFDVDVQNVQEKT